MNSRIQFLIRVLLLTLSQFLIGNFALAQQTQCEQEIPGTSYYYGNGVLTTFLGAAVSLQAVHRELVSNGSVQPGDKFKIAYNRTDNLLADVVEALVQDLQTTFTQVLNLITGALPDSFRDPLIEGAARLNHTLITNEDLDRHVEQYKSDILVGNKVVLIAHSQGNFFGTQAWGLLSSDEQQSFGITSVANPDSSAGGDECTEFAVDTGPALPVLACAASLPQPSFLSCIPSTPRYTTSCTDVVINGLRAIYGSIDGSVLFNYLPRALPPNTNAALSSDLSGHTFVKSYLHPDSPTRPKIISDIQETKLALQRPVTLGDLKIVGTVTEELASMPVVGAKAKIELIGNSLFDAVVDNFTDKLGEYSLCVPSEYLPDQFLLSVSKDGYVPQVRNVAKDGSSSLIENFALRTQDGHVIVIELDPTIHHLGDNNFNGTINSQFQKTAEGTRLTFLFSLTGQQETATAVQLSLHAKGLQRENLLLINGQDIGFLDTSPEDGSFISITFSVPPEILQEGTDINSLTIESFLNQTDYDDFEFANLLLELTLP